MAMSWAQVLDGVRSASSYGQDVIERQGQRVRRFLGPMLDWPEAEVTAHPVGGEHNWTKTPDLVRSPSPSVFAGGVFSRLPTTHIGAVASDGVDRLED
jgi:hypothetical protein